MKKKNNILFILTICLFSAICCNACTPHVSEKTGPESEPVRGGVIALGIYLLPENSDIFVNDVPFYKIDASGAKNIDFTGCTVEYIQDAMPACISVFESMSLENADELIKCLQNASMELTDDYYDDVGHIGERFRITLSSGKVIYVGYDDCYNPDIVTLNGGHFRCDENTIESIKSKIRSYRIWPNGRWYLRCGL